MIIKIQYENQDNIYEIPAKVITDILGIDETKFIAACKKAIMRI